MSEPYVWKQGRDTSALRAAGAQDQHVLRRTGQPDDAPFGQSAAPQDAVLLQEAGVPGVSSAPSAGLLPLRQTSCQLADSVVRTDPDAWQRLTQEVATAHTRYGRWPDRSSMVSERVVNVPDARIGTA